MNEDDDQEQEQPSFIGQDLSLMGQSNMINDESILGDDNPLEESKV